jgi:hypothetical protein
MKKNIYLLTGLIFLAGCKASKLDITQIEFQAGPCFGPCPVFKMIIEENGTTNYSATINNKQQGKFHTVINKTLLNNLNKSLQRANFLSLKNRYFTGWTDQPTYTLSVKLKNGQEKTIEDYGPSGPKKLKSVYKKIFSLRESQSWR